MGWGQHNGQAHSKASIGLLDDEHQAVKDFLNTNPSLSPSLARLVAAHRRVNQSAEALANSTTVDL